jgi:hypothetical protein
MLRGNITIASAKSFTARLRRILYSSPPPDNALFAEIKQKLNPKRKSRKEKHTFVPNKLNIILGDIKTLFETRSLILAEVQDIHYVKKLTLEHKQLRTKLNLFFGKKGFIVVKTPKKALIKSYAG